jgi:hypothetical protein
VSCRGAGRRGGQRHRLRPTRHSPATAARLRRRVWLQAPARRGLLARAQPQPKKQQVSHPTQPNPTHPLHARPRPVPSWPCTSQQQRPLDCRGPCS